MTKPATPVEPQCTNVEISVSTGGRVQLVQFKLSNEFEFSYAEKYTIPADWDEQRVQDWVEAKTAVLKAKVDDFAQTEQDALLTSSDWYEVK